MTMMFRAFMKKIFGAKYERLVRTLLICLIVFWGLYLADWKIRIAPFILYLMSTVFTAGVMWQALCSKDNAAELQNMLMLPFKKQEFVFSYVGALGVYTLLTKTSTLLVIVFAVSVRNVTEILGSVLCAVGAVLVTACIFLMKRYWYVCALWAAAGISVILFLWNSPWFLVIVAAGIVFSVLFLQSADGYPFYIQEEKSRQSVKGRRHHSVWRYFFRYLKAHKNYLMNTFVMWGAACALPLFIKQTENMFVIPICFVILTINTPICILLSCDPDLEQAVHFLPGGKKSFLIPYGLFIFLCNVSAECIFLCSFQMQMGGVTGRIIASAVFYALQSAVCSALLEWCCPIRGWKMESDLWHHPRKYVVPGIMLVLVGLESTLLKIL